MKKSIGILGGMGPLATADLLRKIVTMTKAGCDNEHIRIYIDDYIVVNSGFVNADYIGCDCAEYTARTEVPVYDSMETFTAP